RSYAFQGQDGSRTGWAYSLKVDGLSPGEHTVSGVARDHEGQRIELGERALDFTRGEGAADFSRILHGRPRREGGRVWFGPVQTDGWLRNATSAYGFSHFASQVMRGGGPVLVVGAGVAPVVPGVIQLDIFDYPNIDV